MNRKDSRVVGETRRAKTVVGSEERSVRSDCARRRNHADDHHGGKRPGRSWQQGLISDAVGLSRRSEAAVANTGEIWHEIH